MVVEDIEPVWHAEWEKPGFGPFPFAAGCFNVDMFRYGTEQMHPAHYLLSPYPSRPSKGTASLRR